MTIGGIQRGDRSRSVVQCGTRRGSVGELELSCVRELITTRTGGFFRVERIGLMVKI